MQRPQFVHDHRGSAPVVHAQLRSYHGAASLLEDQFDLRPKASASQPPHQASEEGRQRTEQYAEPFTDLIPDARLIHGLSRFCFPLRCRWQSGASRRSQHRHLADQFLVHQACLSRHNGENYTVVTLVLHLRLASIPGAAISFVRFLVSTTGGIRAAIDAASIAGADLIPCETLFVHQIAPRSIYVFNPWIGVCVDVPHLGLLALLPRLTPSLEGSLILATRRGRIHGASVLRRLPRHMRIVKRIAHHLWSPSAIRMAGQSVIALLKSPTQLSQAIYGRGISRLLSLAPTTGTVLGAFGYTSHSGNIFLQLSLRARGLGLASAGDDRHKQQDNYGLRRGENPSSTLDPALFFHCPTPPFFRGQCTDTRKVRK
jgi:hypothetical protein